MGKTTAVQELFNPKLTKSSVKKKIRRTKKIRRNRIRRISISNTHVHGITRLPR